MIYNKKVARLGGTLAIPLPKEVAAYLNLSYGDEVILDISQIGKSSYLMISKGR